MGIPEPYAEGYLKTSDGHELYYEALGNRDGVPALFLHGGPGAGFKDSHKELFDYDNLNIIFFDQRGAGRSRPAGSLEANTTQDMIADIDTLLDRFDIDKVLLCGGSWGSTLSLAYAIKNPERVSGMLVWGTWFANADDLEYLYKESGKFFPEEYESFIKLVPENERDYPVAYYYKIMTSDDEDARKKHAREFIGYELKIYSMEKTEDEIREKIETADFENACRILTHYMANKSFMENDYLLENASKLSGIPVSIIHGKYDLVCLRKNSYLLHKQIKGSRLTWVRSGHSSSDSELKKAIKSEIKRMCDLM